MTTYLAKRVYTSSGGTDYTAPPYIQKNDISITVNGDLVDPGDWSWFNDSTVRFDVAPASGALVEVRRDTDDDALSVTFQRGPISSDDLNTQFTQDFYLIQEALDITRDVEDLESLAALATEKAEEAAASALAASGSEVNAAASELAASVSEGNAAASELAAGVSAGEALASEGAAQGYADDALGSAGDAAASALEASGYADAAALSAEDALGSAGDASASALEASGYATDAGVSAGEAAASALEADGFAGDAAVSAGEAAASALEAKGYADDAEAAAASLTLPIITGAGDAGKIISVNTAGNGYNFSSPAPTAGDGLVYNGSLWVPQPIGRKNILINGDFKIRQRGGVFTGLTGTASGFLADRWKYGASSAASINTDSTDTTVPTAAQAGFGFTNSLKFTVATADTSVAATDYMILFQLIEGHNIAWARGRTLTLSFWVRSSKTGIFCVAFRSSANDRSYIAEYTINAANTWEKKSIPFVMHDQSSGTWYSDERLGMSVTFTLAAGSNFQSTKDSWLSSNHFATSNQVNFMNPVSGTFYITGIQLEDGSHDTPYELTKIHEQIQRCQRYYEASYTLNVVPGTASTTLNQEMWGASTNPAYLPCFFKVTKRTTPVLASYSPVSGTLNRVYNATTPGDATVVATTTGTGTNRGYISYTATVGALYTAQWIADAEI